MALLNWSNQGLKQWCVVSKSLARITPSDRRRLMHYIILEQPTTNINTKETKDLELVRDMAEMRYLGRFDSKTEEGIFITDDDNKVVF